MYPADTELKKKNWLKAVEQNQERWATERKKEVDDKLMINDRNRMCVDSNIFYRFIRD